MSTLAPWAAALRTLAALPHVHCKLSGMITEAAHGAWAPGDFLPFLDEVLDAFAHPDELDGDAQLSFDCHHDATPGGSVEFGQNDAGH